ncbi:hypothetical protein [Ohtaekwangia sp.]|uniref:hypothetical protein n=1 Tax=Ohtaekwangia sp. TaxID=2066019 RepID=UPI002F93CAD1
MIIEAKKATMKKQMLQSCIRKQQSLIDDFKDRIQALLQTEGLGNEEEYDNTEMSAMQQRIDEISGLHEALIFANNEMLLLQMMEAAPDRIFTEAEPGAVVVTSLGTFFIAVSTEQFQVKNESFIGLSGKSPFFLAMQGKKAGDTFSYHGVTYSILDVF